MRFLIVVPALNEAKSMERVLSAARSFTSADILVVDDGSTDGTATVARDSGAQVLIHPFNLGYGAALQTGYRYALAQGYEAVVQMDADGQHEPGDIPRLMSSLEAQKVDLVIGSRFHGECDYRPSVVRRMGMGLFGAAVRYHTGEQLTDPTSGFQALNRRVLRILSGPCCPVDYPDADVLIMLHRAGLRIAQIPVRMYPNTDKKTMHDGSKPFYYVFKMFLSILVTLLRRNEEMVPS
jgi:glycosyltransferase involved in cell wall biosynthesis